MEYPGQKLKIEVGRFRNNAKRKRCRDLKKQAKQNKIRNSKHDIRYKKLYMM